LKEFLKHQKYVTKVSYDMVRDSFRDYNFMKNNFENNDFYKKL
jgi:hypothetical protein